MFDNTTNSDRGLNGLRMNRVTKALLSHRRRPRSGRPRVGDTRFREVHILRGLLRRSFRLFFHLEDIRGNNGKSEFFLLFFQINIPPDILLV